MYTYGKFDENLNLGKCGLPPPPAHRGIAPGPHTVMARTLVHTWLECLQQHFLMMGALSKMTGNFTILAKALPKRHQFSIKKVLVPFYWKFLDLPQLSPYKVTLQM